MLDRKDAFFCIPLDPNSQEVFALEWENPETGRKTRYTWTVLPQGFKNSLTIFGNQLARELEIWKKENNQEILLKYMDDLLMVAETEEQCTKLTLNFLNFLGISRYRVSKEKNPNNPERRNLNLSFKILKGQRQLGTERKEAMCRLPEPKTKKNE